MIPMLMSIALANTYFRASRLTFGMFPWLPGRTGPVAHAGSGVFVTPSLALTAKHVTDDFLRMDSRVDPVRPPTGYFEPTFSTLIFQANVLGDIDTPVRWSVKLCAPCEYSDLAFIRAIPEDQISQDWVRGRLNYFEWHLGPPPVGSRVHIFGMPGSKVEQLGGNDMRIVTDFAVETAVVTENYDTLRSHGFLEYPCYRIDKPLDHGFSGGPVIWHGMLCGLVSSGPNFDDVAWIAPLWPLLLTKYEREGVDYPFERLFDEGILVARDWPNLRGRVELRACETYAGCLREHAVLVT